MNKLGIRDNSKEEASLLELGKLYCLLVKRPLIDCTEIHIDGSFHCITSIFKQLVTIHAGKNNMVMLGMKRAYFIYFFIFFCFFITGFRELQQLSMVTNLLHSL